MKNHPENTCPFCNSNNVAEILYGMPAYSRKLEKELKSGKLILGGCNISGESPSFQCNDCGKAWRAKNELRKK